MDENEANSDDVSEVIGRGWEHDFDNEEVGP